MRARTLALLVLPLAACRSKDLSVDTSCVTQVFYADLDGDGWGNAEDMVEACSLEAPYVELDGDCDDADAQVYPDAPERCNGVDDDCDGSADEDLDGTFYVDSDGDGYGVDEVEDCDGSGLASEGGDCDDEDSAVNPGAIEICDGIDNDCDQLIDDDDDSLDKGSAVTWYEDADGDGFGVEDGDRVLSCDEPATGYAPEGDWDCDDEDPANYPLALELCDGLDNDCDGSISEQEKDDDGDGYVECTVDDEGWDGSAIEGGGDCNDDDDTVYVGAEELCDGLDNDCDGNLSEQEKDDDGDGYVECTEDENGWDGSTITGDEDCDDDKDYVYPGASELCDGYDNDCNGVEDDGLLGSGTDCAAEDCLEILADQPNATDKNYELTGGSYYCDMTTDGGGWTEVGVDVAVWGTSYDTTYYNSEGFSWEEVLFAYDSGSAHAHCTYPSSLTGCNNLGFQFGTGNWNGAKNWGSSVCGMTVTNNYVNSTSYIGGYDFVIDYGTSTTTSIRLGTLEGISQCTIGDNPGTAYVDIRVR